jgi:hypothetical protein
MIGLLDFAYGDTHWRYTTAPEAVSYGGNTYSAQAGAKMGRLVATRNALRGRFEVTLPWSCPMIATWISTPPDGKVTLTAYMGQGGYYRRWYGGFVKTLEWSQGRLCIVRCVSASNDIGMSGLPLRCGRICRVPLYSARCGVVQGDYEVSGNIGAVDGVTITANEFDAEDDGYWVGGPFEAGGYTRLVIDHTDDTIRINATIPGLTAGTAFTIAAGCKHLQPICDEKFDNLPNMRAQPHIPDTNVFKTGVL